MSNKLAGQLQSERDVSLKGGMIIRIQKNSQVSASGRTEFLLFPEDVLTEVSAQHCEKRGKWLLLVSKWEYRSLESSSQHASVLRSLPFWASVN